MPVRCIPHDFICFFSLLNIENFPLLGIDMMATFLKEILPEPIVKNACDSLDFDPTAKGQYYKGEVTDWFEQVMKEKSSKEL